VKLGAGKSIIVTDGTATKTLLTAGSGAAISGGTGILTVGYAAQTLTANGVTIAGTVAIPAGSTLVPEATNGFTVATGGTVQLPTATSKIVLGDTTITGAASAALAVTAANILFKPNAISASALAKLAVTGGDANIEVGADGTLSLTAVDLDISANGKITLIKGSATAVDAITLVGGTAAAKITFSAETTPTTLGNIAGIGGEASAIDGTGIVRLAAAATDGALYGSIAGGTTATTNDATLSSQASSGNNVVLDKTATAKT
jgi:hypothetical protein